MRGVGRLAGTLGGRNANGLGLRAGRGGACLGDSFKVLG